MIDWKLASGPNDSSVEFIVTPLIICTVSQHRLLWCASGNEGQRACVIGVMIGVTSKTCRGEACAPCHFGI